MQKGNVVTGIMGYVASSMVLLTFITKDMRRLRAIGIVSNVAFISYGMLAWLPPILLLHMLLLPVNVMRLMELGNAPATAITMSADNLPATLGVEA
jgi:hypothetical protein